MTPADKVTTPHVIVLFGATGDLARRKLLPGLLRLTQAGLLGHARIVGTSMEDLTTDEFAKKARSACEDFGKGGRIDRAARKDTEELLQERCSPSEYIDFCGGEKQHSKECRERCGG